MMGSKKGGSGEKPVHEVVLTRPFYMTVTEITQAQWEKVMRTNPSNFKGPNRPVESVSWNDAMEFCERLSEKGGAEYRLPTEAEWEYACRAGATTEYYWGDRMDGGYCWHAENSGGQTHDVATTKPNAWGLYDMSGNVWEWCKDIYGDYLGGKQVDPKGPASGDFRVVRGGAWSDPPEVCRAADRGRSAPSLWYGNGGFRVVRVAPRP